MRRLLCLTTAGLFLLGGTATAAAQPSPSEADQPIAQPLPPPPQPGEPGYPPPPGGYPGYPPPRPTPVPPQPGYPNYLPPRPTPTPQWPYPGYPIPPWPYPTTQHEELTLTVVKTRDPRSRPEYARLRCSPPGGTHPRRREACAVLVPAHGNPAMVSYPSGVFCSRVYDPVRATATGVWNGRYVRFEQTYSNPCMMRRATGPVFWF
ncbi:subtilase-type protease inhibitor [Streptosporangium sp. NBC_01639]|uniref:SSI family serine proteinase inhibitor n=1 Tax=Streptosporangium sp. NBC_01639 TaxID=2975948 RepID=UPI003864C021|nr:subtilase-type protease inhibitor [Streptosporangium sp. NBC_01639]